MDQSIKKILESIDKSIDGFQENIPGIQQKILEEMQPLLKEIEIRGSLILANVQNLKLILQLKNKLEKIIVNDDYKKAVTGFIESFNIVSTLNLAYFAQFNQKYKPSETLPLIREISIQKTINDLTGQGMVEGVIEPIKKILSDNIVTGSNYAKMQEELRNHIISNNTGDGSLARYTRQIVIDSVSQYSRQYHHTIAQDLSFFWGRYQGSNLTTSREFCILLTKKQWVHKSELPTIITGKIDDHKCQLSKTTGLPLGMIPGTNKDNFEIRCGGFLCQHHFYMVPDSAVPSAVKAGIKK